MEGVPRSGKFRSAAGRLAGGLRRSFSRCEAPVRVKAERIQDSSSAMSRLFQSVGNVDAGMEGASAGDFDALGIDPAVILGTSEARSD